MLGGQGNGGWGRGCDGGLGKVSVAVGMEGVRMVWGIADIIFTTLAHLDSACNLDLAVCMSLPGLFRVFHSPGIVCKACLVPLILVPFVSPVALSLPSPGTNKLTNTSSATLFYLTPLQPLPFQTSIKRYVCLFAFVSLPNPGRCTAGLLAHLCTPRATPRRRLHRCTRCGSQHVFQRVRSHSLM